jgi:hypothetical protein
MLKLKVIALFLSLLMVLQMLPISQIGQMLSTNQWTEELPHSSDQAGKSENLLHQGLFPHEMIYHLEIATESKTLAYLHSADQIPSNHSTDVVCPPPDTIA